MKWRKNITVMHVENYIFIMAANTKTKNVFIEKKWT